MTKLGSKSSGCVEAAIGLGPEDTSRLMELHQLYADAGLTSDAALRKAANDLVAELNEEATDITKAVQALMAEGATRPARTVADLEAEAKSITARMKARAKADRAAGLDQISDATLEANRKDAELVSSLMKQAEELKRPKPEPPAAARAPNWFADMTDAQREAVESFAPWRGADGLSLRRGGSGPEDDIYTSAESSFTDFEVVPGVRSVPLSALGDLGGYDSAADADRIKRLAGRINESKEIAPIFVGVDPSGEASIMEGQHRARAFAALGINNIPARVVVDFSGRADPTREYPIAPRDEWYGEGAFSRAGGRMVYVTPDEYLAAVRPLTMDDESRENIDLLKEHIESGKTLDPLLIRASGKEDGRHRAHAAKELGIVRVPVIVYGDQFSDKPTVPAEAYGGDAPGLPLSLVDAAVAQEPDLLFSQRAAPASGDLDLIVTHNLTEANLLHAKKMGGIPVPSLAITKKDAPIDSFGEITLIGPKELADPKGYAGTKVFGADIYSPRYPSVERELDAKQVNALKALVKPMIAKLGESLPGDQELQRDGQRELERSGPMMAAFLGENGVEPTIVTRPGMDPAREARLREFGLGEYLDQEDYQSMMMDEKFAELAVAEYRDALVAGDGSPRLKALAKQLDTNETMRRNAVRDAAQEIARGARARRAPEVDRYATREALDKQINDAGLRDAYDRHVSAWLGRITKSERIYQGFTNSGNRKYTPHTLENVVKILKKELRGGESFNYGVGSLRAKITPEFKSIAAIKKEKGRLTTAADFEKVKKEVDAEFSAISSAISRDLSSDTATAILEDAIKMGALRAAKGYGYDLEPGVSDRINAFLAKLRDLPTAYFEAKVLREVSPSEFSAAVVPDDLGADAMKYLKDSGVKDIRTYKRGDEAGRAAAVMGAADEGLAFSNRAAELPAMIEVDGKQRSTTNSRGQPIASSEGGVRNFWKWFGDSTMVDAKGRPMVVYHGTHKQDDFSEFKPSAAGVVYFTKKKDYANQMAKRRMVIDPMEADDYVGQVLPAYLKIANPATLSVNQMEDLGYAPGFVQQMKGAGNDGAMSRDGQIAVLDPTQIKSATGNNGAFDPNNPDIRFANAAKFQGQELPAETRTQKTRRVAQDYFLRTKVVQDVIIGRGGQVGEAQDVYRAEERMYGRVQAQLEDFAKKWVTPMIEKAAKAGIDMDELALYAYAKHAPERNAYIDTINPAMQGAGSGMSDADAAKIVADVQASGKAQQFEDLRQDLLAITETTRQVLLQDGLITQDEYDAWTGAYQDYVPLRGLENVDDEGRPKPGVGRGVNIRGQESTRALGRRSRAGEIVENIVRDYERAVIRGERNAVAKTFLDLVTTNPDPELWEVNAQKTNRSFSKTLGLVTTSTSTETGDDTIGVKVGGQQVYIKVKDPLLVRAMRQAAKDETGEFQAMLAKSLGVYNNWLRNTLTRYNPVFGAVNAVRDLQAGAVATLDKLGARGLKLYASHYRAALAASVRNEFDALGKQGAVFGDPVMDRWFDEYRRAGGTTAGWFLRDVEDIHTDIRQMLVAAGSAPRNTGERITGSVAWQGAKALLKYVELFGSASENAGRVAAYRAAREMGRSPAEAASIAKNLTTNFNRKGEWGTALSSAYLFFNAAVQGTARVLEALKSPRVQGLMAGVTGLAATLAVMGAEMGGDDDDGQAYWDKIPQHEKERNLIIMLPPGIQTDGAQKVGGMGRYIKIPMPYGFNVFATLGYTMADVGRNATDPARGVKPAKAAINMVSAVAGSYNPMGGAFDVTDPVAVGMAVAPTIVDAGIQLGAGVNSFGTPVGPKGSPFDSRPDSERFTVTQGGGAAQRLARWVNEATGGNRARSGAIDLMPGTIENVVNMAGGGTGRFLMDVFVNVPTKLSGTGDEEAVFRYRDLPFLRNFAGQVDENVDRGLFYERMDEVLKEARTAKNEMKMGIVVKYDPRSRAMQSLGKMADGYSGLMTDLRKEDLQIVNDPSLTAPEKKMMRRDVEKRRNELVREFNRIWIETERDLARGSFDKE